MMNVPQALYKHSSLVRQMILLVAKRPRYARNAKIRFSHILRSVINLRLCFTVVGIQYLIVEYYVIIKFELKLILCP